MKKDKIMELLKDYPQEKVEKFATYIIGLYLAIDKKTGKKKNYWIQNKPENEMAILFKRVLDDGLVFDGVSVTLQSTGISYNYNAYKNKMLIVYPESVIDVELVYKGETFNYSKSDGKVFYNHEIKAPFLRKDSEIVGGYCIIRNKRGEFMTVLNSEELEKHRKIAKTDYIWKEWYVEMCKKTLIKKACSQHYKDIYTSIDSTDNNNYNLENPLDIDLSVKQLIDNANTLEELQKVYFENKAKVNKISDFNKYINIKKKELNNENT